MKEKKPSVFRVKAFDDKNFKRQKIGTIFGDKYAFDFDLLIESDEFKTEIRDFFLDVNWASFTDIAIDISNKENCERKVIPRKLIYRFFKFLKGQSLQTNLSLPIETNIAQTR